MAVTTDYFSFKDFIYLFLERGEGKERGREVSVCGCLSRAPYWGPGLQPRHVPLLGIEPVTLWFAAHTQSTELHQPGLILIIYFNNTFYLTQHI